MVCYCRLSRHFLPLVRTGCISSQQSPILAYSTILGLNWAVSIVTLFSLTDRVWVFVLVRESIQSWRFIVGVLLAIVQKLQVVINTLVNKRRLHKYSWLTSLFVCAYQLTRSLMDSVCDQIIQVVRVSIRLSSINKNQVLTLTFIVAGVVFMFNRGCWWPLMHVFLSLEWNVVIGVHLLHWLSVNHVF